MREYLVSGVPLRDPSGKFFIDYTRSILGGDASRVITTSGDFGFHGGLPESDNYFTSSRDTLVLNVLGDTATEHTELLKAFQGLFSRRDFQVISAPHLTPLAAGSGLSGRTFNVATALLREARGRMIGNAGIERINSRTVRMTVLLENIWGFWRSTVDYTSTPLVASATSQAWDLSSVAGDSTAPLVAGALRVKGPLPVGGYAILTDANSTKGVGWKAASALGATEYVIVDFLTMKASKVTTDTWTGGTDVSSGVQLNGEGAFALEPGAPLSTFPTSAFTYNGTVSFGGATNGSTAVEFRARRSYLS